MQTYTFTQSELRYLIAGALMLFASKPNVYDVSGNAQQLTVAEVMERLKEGIPFEGEPIPVSDTSNAEFDAAIEIPF